MKNVFIFSALTLFVSLIISCKKDEVNHTVIDIEGNEYDTITIGDQTWMEENLKTTKYKDGTAIPLVTDNTIWDNLTTPAYCWYTNDEAKYKNTFGALYNWYAVCTFKLCPDGWHIPPSTEWMTLDNYLIANGFNYDGTKTGNKFAKAMASTKNWTFSPIEGSPGNTDYPAKRNATGFTALPGGFRGINGGFGDIYYNGYFWTAPDPNAWYWCIFFDNSSVKYDISSNQSGYSVRCVKD